MWRKSLKIEEAQLHPKKVTVQAAISSHVIIEPVFIRGTVTLSSYHSSLKDDVIPAYIRGHLKSTVYQQDGVEPHTSDENLLLLWNTFKNHVISNRFPQMFNTGWNWPPYSPDLKPCDYFLWDYLKNRVYINNRKMPEALEWKLCELCETFLKESIRLWSGILSIGWSGLWR